MDISAALRIIWFRQVLHNPIPETVISVETIARQVKRRTLSVRRLRFARLVPRIRSAFRSGDAAGPMPCCITPTAAASADSNGHRNTLKLEIAMSIQKRRSARSGRSPLPSPGRPQVAGRDEQSAPVGAAVYLGIGLDSFLYGRPRIALRGSAASPHRIGRPVVGRAGVCRRRLIQIFRC